MPNKLTVLRTAVFSEDRSKRYLLTREWEGFSELPPHVVNFVMLNPSVADDARDDPTIRKCMGFAQRWGYSKISVTNLVATVETDPWKLPHWSGIDYENRKSLLAAISQSHLNIAAWGSQPAALWKSRGLDEHLHDLKSFVTINWYCIGKTRWGAPLHPSRAAYTSHAVLWRTNAE